MAERGSAETQVLEFAESPRGLNQLARLAFGSGSGSPMPASQHRHLSFMPAEALDLDLSDPIQCELGDYRLKQKLGQGGMGVVYLAEQRSLKREVALKLLAAGPWASDDFISRFRFEAQAAARLNHPNIVQIYEIGRQDDLNYFSMQLVRGRSLAEVLHASGTPDARQAARWMLVVADALNYAHRLGLLHLDLKPGNILIDEAGEPHVADFGLARQLDASLSVDTDEVSGTPSYMAPEQAVLKSHRLSVGTDIYGLGAILYELLCGQPPFRASTPIETLRRVQNDPPQRPSSLNPKVPADLEAICMRCLQKAPTERYSQVTELADDLRRYLDGRTVSVRMPTWRERLARWVSREPRLAVASALVLCTLLGGVTATSLQWRRAESEADAARVQGWTLKGQVAHGAMAEGDGFRALRPLLANLAEMEARGDDARALMERQRIGSILANAPTIERIIDLEAGIAINSVAISGPANEFAVATHAQKGQRGVRAFALDSGQELWQANTDDLSFGLPWNGAPHGWLRYSADGSRLLVSMPHQSPFPYPRIADVIGLDAATGTLLVPPGRGEDYYDLVSDDQYAIALVRHRTDPSHRFPDRARFHRVSDWRPIGPEHRFDTTNMVDSWLPSPDGQVWLGASGTSDLRLYRVGTLEELWRFQSPEDPVMSWRFSPDGRQIALGTTQGRVVLVDVASGQSRSLGMMHAETVRWLEFDKDGARLASRAEDATLQWVDLAKGRVLSQIRPRLTSSYGAVTIAKGTLHATGGGVLQSWQIQASTAPFGNLAVSAPFRIRHRRSIDAHGFARHEDRLITAGTDGRIVVWRMPPEVIRPFRAAPMPTDTTLFFGDHLASVDGNAVTIHKVFDETLASRRFHFPEPVRLAELTPDGRSLVTVVGRTIRIVDVATGKIRGAPVVLPNAPVRADLAENGAAFAVGHLDHDGDALVEHHVVVSVDRGQVMLEAATEGFTKALRLAPDGRRLLILRVADRFSRDVLSISGLDGTNDCRQFESAVDLTQMDALEFTEDGSRLWVHQRLPRRQAALVQLDLEQCKEIRRIDIQGGNTQPHLEVRGDQLFANQLVAQAVTVFEPDGTRRDVPVPMDAMQRSQFGLSADGRLAAFATRNSMHVLHLPSGQRVTADLAVAIAGDDSISQVQLSADGDLILARTTRGRWLAWQVPVETSSVEALQELVRVLDPRNSDQPLARSSIDRIERRFASRATEPGPVEIVHRFDAEAAEAADPRFIPVDLAPAINAPLNGNWPARLGMGGDLPTLTLGRQRLAHVDWRIDGGVQLSRGGAAASLQPTEPVSARIPVGPLVAARVHALVRIHIPQDQRAGPSTAARIVLIEPDGSETPLDVLMKKHVTTASQFDEAMPEARIGWIGTSAVDVNRGFATAAEVPPAATFVVSLEVPDSVGSIAAIRLETRDGPMEAPLFYAVTFEVPQGDRS